MSYTVQHESWRESTTSHESRRESPRVYETWRESTKGTESASETWPESPRVHETRQNSPSARDLTRVAKSARDLTRVTESIRKFQANNSDNLTFFRRCLNIFVINSVFSVGDRMGSEWRGYALCQYRAWNVTGGSGSSLERTWGVPEGYWGISTFCNVSVFTFFVGTASAALIKSWDCEHVLILNGYIGLSPFLLGKILKLNSR